MQVRPLPSTPTRRSSAEQSAALRRRRSHVRIVPARQQGQALVAQEESTSLVRTRSWVRLPPRAPRKGPGQMRNPCATWRGVTRCGCESHPFRTRRDGREVKTPGPQPGGRGSNPRRGTNHTHARWSSGKTSGCYPEGGGSSPSLAARRSTLGGRGVQARGCKPRDGGAIPSRASIARPVVVVQRRGSRCATPVMRVRVPPTTRTTTKQPTHREEGGEHAHQHQRQAHLLGERDRRGDDRAGREDRSAPDRRGSRRAHARRARRHRRHRRLGHPDPAR